MGTQYGALSFMALGQCCDSDGRGVAYKSHAWWVVAVGESSLNLAASGTGRGDETHTRK